MNSTSTLCWNFARDLTWVKTSAMGKSVNAVADFGSPVFVWVLR